MELQVVNRNQNEEREMISNPSPIGTRETKEENRSPFIEANTTDVSLSHLKEDCIIPVFAKDNEQTIAHQEFIDVALECASSIFLNEDINNPEVRVSHQIKGRTPDAIHIPAKELKNHQKTIYYERMAFLVRIPSITDTINGNELSLSIGGVRAYNKENLFSKKKMESFKFFIGFQNMVCCNMCISTDGYKGEVKASSHQELKRSMLQAIQTYRMEEHIQGMARLQEESLSEKQFAQLLGKAKLYNYLPKAEKSQIPQLLLNDNHFTTVAKDYYQDKSFCKDTSGKISLWNAYNLLTGANKSSYIDTFLDRGENAYAFAQGISKAINGDSQYRWFLS
ncbi:DUF3871 family protein [Gramella sp. KN1008]|uniref:DUF3871 family protein n=1 Tax=Gramella sp. KN1008 TaxID=2529298 RepID=UPI00103B0B92|nr:DUF3871 family protein [Gramella sp. KN1008]TBW25812.1 DUF3871 family protein [Gramella sp. KN1008]